MRPQSGQRDLVGSLLSEVRLPAGSGRKGKGRSPDSSYRMGKIFFFIMSRCANMLPSGILMHGHRVLWYFFCAEQIAYGSVIHYSAGPAADMFLQKPGTQKQAASGQKRKRRFLCVKKLKSTRGALHRSDEKKGKKRGKFYLSTETGIVFCKKIGYPEIWKKHHENTCYLPDKGLV